MLKKAPYQAPDANLIAGREVAYNRVDRDLYIDVGFFIARFSLVELALTKILAASTRTVDIEAFDILCRGMDARVKIQRLRISAERHGGIGPNLSKRLEKIEKGAIPLRNKIAHASLSHSEDEEIPTYYLAGLANLPWQELDMGTPVTSQIPDKIRSLDLYAWGVWLSYFGSDLVTAFARAAAQQQIEIAEPTSRLR